MAQPLASDVISNNAMVDQFTQAITQARNTRISLVSNISADFSDVQTLINSKDQTMELFQTQALNLYPNLAGQDIMALLPTLDPVHPLVQLWSQYSGSIGQLNVAITQDIQDIQNQNDALFIAEQLESQNLQNYDKWSKQANTSVPTTAQLQAGLPPVPVISTDQITNLPSSVPAIEQLDPEAAAAVTTQMVSIQQADNVPITAPPTSSPVVAPMPPPAAVKPTLWHWVIGSGLAYIFLS